MAGYQKQFNSGPGDIIGAELFDDEYQLISNAFNANIGHNHDGTSSDSGAPIPLIADPNFLNTVEINPVFNHITFSTDFGGTKNSELRIEHGILTPIINGSLDLGTDTERFNNLYITGTVDTPRLDFTSGAYALDILDEDDMISDSNEVLATQQSIKAYVDTTVTNSPGLFKQALFASRETDFALSGAMADYLTLSITVEEGSYVHIHSHMAAKGENVAGGVLATIFRDTIIVSPEAFYVTSDSVNIDFAGSTGRVDRDGPLTAGTYTYAIKMREELTDGTATEASLLLLEETA